MIFQDRSALVTGGSRGIGRAVALELARGGANIAIAYAGNEEAAAETLAACKALGVQAIAIRADVRRAEDCAEMVKETLAAFGRLDILVNNAGITRDGLLLSMSEENWDAVLETNLKGAALATKAALRPMMKQRFGRIVNLSSIAGVSGNAGQANYSASKAGLIGLSKSVAKELATRGITVNVVAPGLIETDMAAALPPETQAAIISSIPVGRIGAPEDVARAVAFFAAPENSYLTGQLLCVDGGAAV